MKHDTHSEATARDALHDVARFAATRATIARAQAVALADGRLAWAALAGHTLDSIRLGVTAAGRELAPLALRGVDVHRIAAEVRGERRRA